MDYSRRLSLSEFTETYCSDENLQADNLRIESISYKGESYSLSSRAISASSIEEFTARSNSLLSASAFTSSSSPVRDKYDINWCSLSDYCDNWSKLSEDDKSCLSSLVSSDTLSNANRYGVKKRNLESHLLLNIGCDMTNILNSGYDSVLSNLKISGEYNSNCSENRTVDPKTCLRAYKRFDKTFSVEALFDAGLVAFQAVVSSDTSYRSLENPHEAKERYQNFFKSNADKFSRLCSRRKLILSYVYSNEISVDSILGAKYRPHTHIIFFVERKKNRETNFEEALHFAEEFNSMFSDRVMTIDTIEIDGALQPRMSKKYADISTSFEYLFRAYSLADQYLREIRENNIRELNKATVECYRNLVWLFKGDDGGGKSVRRFNSSFVPKRLEAASFKHPLLQKRKKSNKIKKTVKKNASLMTAQEILKQAIDNPVRPVKPVASSAAARPLASKVQKPSSNILQGLRPSPEMPWVGQRGTPEDLASFGVSPEDFFGGGGRIMFSDRAPSPAANPVAAPVQPLQKRSNEESYLLHLREKLQKTAGDKLALSRIIEVTSSRENFEKAAEEEALEVWKGMREALEKEGANEDFILGMLKEAEEQADPTHILPPQGSPAPAANPPLGNLPSFDPPASKLDNTGMPSDRHRVLPFMGNNILGSLGGAFLGSLVGNELGLEGPMSWLAPILGGLAGHKYFPHMMNKWKDPYGQGLNKIDESAASFNKAHPFSEKSMHGPVNLPHTESIGGQ